MGRKLDYQYGKANGNSHTNDRTFGLLKEMDKLGFSDTPDNRAFFEQYYNDVLNGKNSVIVNESLSIQGRSVWFATTRESFLMGKYGGAKVETVWDGNRLITMIIHSGEQTRYHHVGGK